MCIHLSENYFLFAKKKKNHYNYYRLLEDENDEEINIPIRAFSLFFSSC